VASHFAFFGLSFNRATAHGRCSAAMALLLAWNVGASWGQSAQLSLRSSPLLEETVSERQRSEGAVFVKGAQITARPDMDLLVQGQASIRRPGLSLSADRLDYDQTQDKVDAQDQVRVSTPTSVFSGPRLQLKVDSFQGRFENPEFELYASGGYGQASEVEFVDNQRTVVRQAKYTTCRRTPGPEWLPEWLLKATQLTIDEEESSILAQGVQLRFQDTPIFAAPSISLPLTNERKSGLLPPLFSVDTVNGIEVAQPYYFDIAPNRDATVTTHVMSQRGIAADTEFRYLERDYSGQLRLNLMPLTSCATSADGAYPASTTAALTQALTASGELALA
jgi:LPS-assembly protein